MPVELFHGFVVGYFWCNKDRVVIGIRLRTQITNVHELTTFVVVEAREGTTRLVFHLYHTVRKLGIDDEGRF